MKHCHTIDIYKAFKWFHLRHLCTILCTIWQIPFITMKLWNVLLFQDVKKQSSQNSCAKPTTQLERRHQNATADAKWWAIGMDEVDRQGYIGTQAWAVWISRQWIMFTVKTEVSPKHSILSESWFEKMKSLNARKIQFPT